MTGSLGRVQRELSDGPERGLRFTLLEGGPRWRLMSLFAAVLVVIAAVVTVTLWVTNRSGPGPEETTRRFLEATSCSELRDLADDHADAALDRSGCQALIDAAELKRTYGDPRTLRRLERSLSVGRAMIDGGRAEVTVTVSYTEDGRRLPSERMGVVLLEKGGRWRVDDWGSVN